MTYLVMGLMAFGATLLVGWPLLAPKAGSASATDTPAVDERIGSDLLSERELLYRAIAELDFDFHAGKLSESDYRQLRHQYEAQAVEVLKRIDALGARAPSPDVAVATVAEAAGPEEAALAPSWLPRPRTIILSATAVGLLGLGLLVGLLASGAFRPRLDLPMPSMPGMNMPAMSGAASGDAQGARSISPDMLAGMLSAAHASLEAGRGSEAIAAYRAILDRDPRNVEALTHLGVILREAGELDTALIALDRAVAIDPSYPHALWDQGQTLYRKGDYRRAIAAWERFLAIGPQGKDAETVRGWIANARQQLQQALPAGRTGRRVP